MKKVLAVSALPLALLFGAAFQMSVPDQLKAILSGISDLKAQNDSLANKVSNLEAQNASLAAQVAANGPRKFYLTKTPHNGAGALSACDTGYHMASLWEIHDPTNLRYNTELGSALGDSGSGPPTGVLGWIRTGNPFPNSQDAPGTANCNGWTTADAGPRGTGVSLPVVWALTLPSTSVVDPWRPTTVSCNTSLVVWCVQD